jgi:hypothetical protein
MGDFDIPDNSLQWAKNKGMVRRCSKHEKNFDSSVGCSMCNQEKQQEAAKRRKEVDDKFHKIMNDLKQIKK